MNSDTATLNTLWAELIVEELVRNGVDTFVISPGSRSAPLTVAAARNPKAKTTVHYDERGAAFFALGAAKALGKPCALICTSGTAVANYFPAIVEASMSYVPLVVLTADRPPELLNTGANQTIDQTRIYGEYVRHFVAMPCPDEKIALGFVLATIDHAVYKARQAPAGPVHVNCAFREPLAPPARSDSTVRDVLQDWAVSSAPFTRCMENGRRADLGEFGELVEKIQAERKLLIVVGQTTRDDGLLRNIELSTLFRNTPIFADATSGVRVRRDAPTIANYDLLLQSPAFRDLCCPDAVVHFGGAIVSKRLQQYLASVRPKYYLRVADHTGRLDPGHCVTHRYQMPCSDFVALPGADAAVGAPDWTRKLVLASDWAQRIVSGVLHGEDALSEPAIAATIGRMAHDVPLDALFLGNSMPVRDFDTYGGLLHKRTLVTANRGASGIDGNIATAAGFARARGHHVTAVIGDLAALHDLNSLALLKQEGVRVTLVILNNDGGGIFHYLPIAEHADVFEKYFATPHGMRFDDAARMFGLPYARPTTRDEFAAALTAAHESGVSAIVEVATHREENLRIHRKIADAVVKALADL